VVLFGHEDNGQPFRHLQPKASLIVALNCCYSHAVAGCRTGTVVASTQKTAPHARLFSLCTGRVHDAPPRPWLLPTLLLFLIAPLPAQLVGGQWDMSWQFDGQAQFDRLGYSVSGAGDVDGDGFDDLLVGANLADPGGLSLAGSAYVYSLDPFLHPSSNSLSASGGSTVQLDMDFPSSESGAQYAVLASISGTGPIVMGGLEILLTQDIVFDAITSGNVPSVLQGAFGTLDANGQALATLSTGPGLNRIIGQTIYFAAVTYSVGPLTGRMSSVVRYLQITP
jgi:FG-GAP repeat protein